ncbi:MAG: hypothetical protein PUD20_00780 [bacterium]|nr:hypothetical protein [bacterium]
MAEKAKKWKLGDLEFDTEQEYKDATQDLKKIKEIMDAHDITKPREAKAVLDELKREPKFLSAYGEKFVEKLEKTAESLTGSKKQPKKSQTQNRAKVKKPVKENKIHIITRRNIIIGVVIIALLVLAKLFVPGLLEKKGEEEQIHRNLVLAYAKNQVELQNSFYHYYKDVLGEADEAALTAANNVITNAYEMNLADENVIKFSDKEIEDIYVRLLAAGDIEGQGFNEPQEITDLKQTIAQSAAGNVSGSLGAQGEEAEKDAQVGLVNRLMDYQHRMATQLAYSYSQFGFDAADVTEYATEDMEKIFGSVIYDMELSEAEKEAYYSDYYARGFFDGNSLVRLTTNPIDHALPDLTPTIKLVYEDGKTVEVTCSQQTLAPIASVAYELHAGNKKGYLVFRNNGSGSDFVQDDDGNSVTMQGEVFLNWDGEVTVGEWYYNSLQLGCMVGDKRELNIQYVYEIKY